MWLLLLCRDTPTSCTDVPIGGTQAVSPNISPLSSGLLQVAFPLVMRAMSMLKRMLRFLLLLRLLLVMPTSSHGYAKCCSGMDGSISTLTSVALSPCR